MHWISSLAEYVLRALHLLGLALIPTSISPDPHAPEGAMLVAVRDVALASVRVKEHVGDRAIAKAVYVPGRLINLVLRKEDA